MTVISQQEVVDDDAGAAGGVEAANLQQGVGALMNAMRELLNNIRPVEPPVEDDDDDVHDAPEVDEWD